LLKILSPERSHESRLSSPSKENLSFSARHSLDSPDKSPKLSPIRSVLEEAAPDSPQLSPTPSSGIQTIVNSGISPERKTIVISEDPDLQSARFGKIKLGIRYTASRRGLSVAVYCCK